MPPSARASSPESRPDLYHPDERVSLREIATAYHVSMDVARRVIRPRLAQHDIRLGHKTLRWRWAHVVAAVEGGAA